MAESAVHNTWKDQYDEAKTELLTPRQKSSESTAPKSKIDGLSVTADRFMKPAEGITIAQCLLILDRSRRNKIDASE